MQWWGQPENEDTIAAHLRGEDGEFLLVIEVDHAVAGGIQYYEESDPMYRHAGIDIISPIAIKVAASGGKPLPYWFGSSSTSGSIIG